MITRRYFSSTGRVLAEFDSAYYVAQLEQAKLSRTQAEALIQSLQKVISESHSQLQSRLVPQSSLTTHLTNQTVSFTSLRHTLSHTAQKDLMELKAELDGIRGQLESVRTGVREEKGKMLASVRLDLNLEKGRIRDLVREREVKLTEVGTRIENEIGQIRTNMEAVKFNILQYSFAVMSGSGALLLAYLRMFA